MSVIPQVYNQGTGLIGSTTEGNVIPKSVDTLIVESSFTSLGNSNFAGPVLMNSTLDINGAVTVNGSVAVSGALILDTLEVENATVNQDLTVHDTTTLKGDTTIETNLTIQGQVLGSLTTFANDLKVMGNLDIGGTTIGDGNVTIDGTLDVNEDCVCHKDLDVVQALGVTGLTTVGNIVAGGTLGVTGLTTVDNIVAGGTLGVTGLTSAHDIHCHNLTASVHIDSDSCTVTNQLQSGSVIVNDNATVAGKIGQSSSTWFQLPTATGSLNQVLSKGTGDLTVWKDDAVVNDYVSYSTSSNNFENNTSGTTATIDQAKISVLEVDILKFNNYYWKLPLGPVTDQYVMRYDATGASGLTAADPFILIWASAQP
jgi:cytoskeletal protein CcmA (bactofilin family)